MKRNARPLVIEFFKAIERAEGRGSVDRARAAARAAGAKFSNSESIEWLRPFLESATERRDSRRENGGEIKHETARKGRAPRTRARKGISPNNDPNTPIADSPKKARRMKQAAFDLGDSAPEIDHDKSRYAMPDGLPEFFPEPLDELREIAATFVRIFGNCKRDEKVRENVGKFTDTIAIFRQKGKSVAIAWQCFLDAVAAQEWAPLHGAQSRRALAYLRGGNGAFTPKGPRVDSCGCPLPDGVVMPRLQKGETAHWDGDEFLFGSESDIR